jgi:hypothetical protein
VNDPAWKEESLRLAAGICEKIADCGKETGAFQGLDPNHQELVEKRLSEVSCQDHHRKTNVYLLAGSEPERIKKIVRSCHRNFLKLTCSDLVAKKYSEIESCVLMGKIQMGESIETASNEIDQ